MSATLREILEKKASQIKPESIDWGYCIPDCGECCNVLLTMPAENAQKIAQSFGFGIEGLFDLENGNLYTGEEHSFVIIGKQKCILQYSYHLCSIQKMEERSPICRNWFCYMAYDIRDLKIAGYDIASRLRESWLKQLKNKYNQENWLAYAEEHIKIAKKFILEEKISPEKAEELIIHAIGELNIKRSLMGESKNG